MVYATSFSGFYVAMYITLAALWLRPLALDYRSKIEDPRWRQTWDYALCISGTVPAIIFGVAVGNLPVGVPFEFNELLMSHYQGNIFGLLNPFALLCGVLALSLFILQGSTWLQMKTTEELYKRSRNVGQVMGLVVATLFVIGGF